MSIKVCHVVESLDNTYGGPARSIPSLCVPLQSMNVENSIHSVDAVSGSSNDIVDRNSLDWIRYEPRGPRLARFSANLMSLGDYVKANGVDIIHLHSLWTYPSYVALQVAKKLDLPLILSARSNLYQASLKRSPLRKSIVKRLFVNELLGHVSCIHATSDEEAAEIDFLKLGRKIVVVGNGVSAEEFNQLPAKNISRERFDIPEDRLVVLFFSRVHPRKGLHRFVNAWRSVANEFPEVDLLVAGPNEDSTYFEAINKSVRDSGLEARFRYAGMLSGEARLEAFSAADLFVLPSDFENFGMAVAEALAAGLPVITTHGTPWSVIQEVSAGWWVDPDETNLREALVDAIRSRSMLPEMGERGREMVKDQFGWKEAARKMLSVYEQVIKGELAD